MRQSARFICLLLALAGLASPAWAQAWPARPVRIIVPGPAGSAPDVVARLLGDRLGQIWQQSVIVENRAGAGGNIGTLAGAKAEPDGYTLTFGQSAPLALNMFTYKVLPFDPEKDFAAIVLLGISPMMISVNRDLPANTLAELIALAKAKPGMINFATSNSKNIAHLTGAILARMAGIDIVHVPYQSNAMAGTDTVEGRTQIYIDGIPPMSAYLRAGSLRPLAVSTARRLPNFPNVPAVSETVPGYAFVGWFTLMAPAGTPADLLAKINRDANVALAHPVLAERLEALGIYDAGGTPEEVRAFMRKEREGFAEAVKAAGIRPE